MKSREEEIRALLSTARTIAVVGLSDKPDRDSNGVARYLLGQGYDIIPVNPNLTEVLGRRSYPSLRDIPTDREVDIVDIFRRSDQVPPVVDDAIARGVGAVWMQLGVRNEAAAKAAESQGIPVYQDLCIMQEHRRLHIGPVGGGTPTRGSQDY
jgi:uncharacterized protein